MDPITGGWLLATLCGAGISRAQVGERYVIDARVPRSDRLIAEPYKSKGGSDSLARPSASYAARSESIRKLRELRELQDGWDGHEAVKPDGHALDAAEVFIQMMPAGIETPRIGLASDGELGFFWENAETYIDLSFAGDNTFSYYANTQLGESGGEDIHFGSELFQHLLTLLPPVAQGRLAA